MSTQKRSKQGRGCTILAVVVLVGAVLIVAGLGVWVLGFAGTDQTSPAGDGGEVSPEALAARRARARERLNTYDWVDEPAGLVRIPIEQAMAVIAESGLPVGNEGLETPTPTPTPELPTATSPPADSDEPAATPPAEASTSLPVVEDATPTPEPSPTLPPTPTVDLANVSFQEHVVPIFEAHCFMCHGGEDPEGGQRLEEGLSLLTPEEVLAGSWNGSVVEPGDPEASYLIEQVVTGRMPKEGERLTPEEIEAISAWIEAGAPDN